MVVVVEAEAATAVVVVATVAVRVVPIQTRELARNNPETQIPPGICIDTLISNGKKSEFASE